MRGLMRKLENMVERVRSHARIYPTVHTRTRAQLVSNAVAVRGFSGPSVSGQCSVWDEEKR